MPARALGAALFAVVVLCAMTPTRGAAQGLPAPPRTDRQPVGLAEPRVPPLLESQWTDRHRDLARQYRGDGRADNQLHTLMNVPEIVEGLMPFTAYLTEESTLSPRHRELLVLRVAWLSGNQPVWATHASRARDAGLSTPEIHRVAEGPEAAGWNPFEQTLLRLADQLFVNSSVTASTWSALSATYDEPHLMDAVETVNHFTVLSMIYNSYGVQPNANTPDRLPTDVTYQIVVPEREPALRVARFEPLAGDGIAVSRTFARYPDLARPRGRRANYINRVSPLSPRDREILILRIGWNCQAEYEWAKHVGTVGRARDHGVDPVAVAEGPAAHDSDTFDATLLRVVDELYQDSIVSDQTWAALGAGYDLVQTMSAVYTPSSYRATSMSLNTYGVQLEAGDEGFPNVPR